MKRYIFVGFMAFSCCVFLASYRPATAQCDCTCPPNTYCATFTPTASPSLIPTNTLHAVFQTATAAQGTPTPTRTTVPLQTPIPSPTATFAIPNTPTQEIFVPTPQRTAVDNFSCWRVVATRGLNVRRGSFTQPPNTNAVVVSSIRQGDFFKAYDFANNAGYLWGRVGQTSWVALEQGALILAERADRRSCANTLLYP